MNKKVVLTLLLILAVSPALAGTVTVTTTLDDGPGSLRQAIRDAKPGDTIVFNLPSPSTITLTSGQLTIDKDLIISGPGAAKLTVQSTDVYEFRDRIFEVAPGADVAGVIIPDAYDVSISGLTISRGNRGSRGFGGGGLLNRSSGHVELRSCVVTDSYGGSTLTGGGIENRGHSLSVIDCTISRNFAGPLNSRGGGISNLSGKMLLMNSTISENTADTGGGVYNTAELLLLNSTVSTNYGFSSHPKRGYAGAVYHETGTTEIINSTIAKNSATIRPGGIQIQEGNVTLRNSIVAANASGSGAAPDIIGVAASRGYNLIGNSQQTMVTPATGDQIGTPEAPIDPKLGDLQDNGGATKTHALLPGSPAIDRGHSSDSSTDQRNLARPVDDPARPNAPGGDGSDIGAYEEQVIAPPAARAVNISTRSRVASGDQAMIGGFIVTGGASKRVIIRAIGPSMNDDGVINVLADPIVTLHGPDGSLLASNDNWRENPAQAAEIQASGIPPEHDLESAIVATLPAAPYTAVVQDKDQSSGVALVEIYDLEEGGASRLGNVSTRGAVGSGEDVMIGGFVLGGSGGGSPMIVVRALGPSLAQAGVSGTLADPELELRDANGALVVANEDWQDNPEQANELSQSDFAPRDSSEAAVILRVPPGAYTAIVSSADGSTGVALVEAYDLG